MEDLELEETNIRDFTYLKNYRPEMMSVKRLLGTHGSPKKVFSKISCVGCPLSSIALSTFPSNVWWKIPKDEWNLSIKEALLPIICSNYKQFRFMKQSPASSTSREERRNIKKSRECNKIC